jgi:holo-[acyl-carrier protein] synthase
MIFGIGTDVVQVERIARSLDRFGDRFAERVLMPEELELYLQQTRKVRFVAMRFAAKEAVVKAMGTGFAHGMWIRDVGVVPDVRGKPEVIFSRRGQAMCAELGIADTFVSLTDEAGLVVAVAVLTRA